MQIFRLLLLIFLFSPGFSGTTWAAQPVMAFEYRQEGLKTVVPGVAAVTRTPHYPIRFNRDIADLPVHSMMGLDLPGSLHLDVEIRKRVTAKNGDVIIYGKTPGDGLVVFTIGSDSVFGTIEAAGQQYGISTTRSGGEVLTRSLKKPTGRANDMVIPKDFRTHEQRRREELEWRRRHPDAALNLPESRALASAASTIDLMVIYSPEFGAAYSSPETRINAMIAFTNAALSRSGINAGFQLVHAYSLGFDQSLSRHDLLDAVTTLASPFENSFAIRNQYAADMVAVLGYNSSLRSEGLAWLNGDRPRYAYSVIKDCCSSYPNVGNSVFAHELGHNLGSGHERSSANPSQPGPCTGGYTGYACGHGNHSAGWGTIMSYLDDASVGYKYSNPALDCAGEPCGIAQGQPEAADNHASFEITRGLVAAFRPATPPRPPETISAFAALDSTTQNPGVQIDWWNAPDAGREIDYRSQLFRCNTAAESSCALDTDNAVSGQFDFNVLAGRRYYYRVRGCHAGSVCGGLSNADDAYVAVSTPQASDGDYFDRVEINWAASVGAQSYEIYRCADTTTGSCSRIGSGPALSYSDNGAVVGNGYYYRIKACDSSGCSDVMSDYTWGRRGVPAPANVSASDYDTGRMRVSWDSVAGADGYHIYLCTGDAESDCPSWYYFATSSPSDYFPAVGVVQYVRVKACVGYYCSSFSNYDPGKIDTDQDSDGVGDGIDNCPAVANGDQLDSDGDSQGDACDSDNDNDGVADASDCAPLDDGRWNNLSGYLDADADGIGGGAVQSVCSGNALPSGYQATGGDNCPDISNPDQTDTDGDQLGDACDPHPNVPDDDEFLLTVLPAILAAIQNREPRDPGPGSSCGNGKVYDCVQSCVDSSTAQSWIGDGVCDDGTFGMDLRCPAFQHDGGDCN